LTRIPRPDNRRSYRAPSFSRRRRNHSRPRSHSRTRNHSRSHSRSRNWENTSSTGRIKTGSYGPFGPNDILAVRFTIPANHTAGGLKFSMAEWGGGPVQRDACISQAPGDFSGMRTGVSARTSVNVVATIGGQPQPYQAHLQPGQTYYLNVKNLSCQADTCDMFIDFTKW
jgi:hypothetical protein